MTAPSFLAWVPAVAAVSTASNISGTFVNNGGPGDTISDTAGTAALTVDSHTVALGDRILVNDQSSSYENGVYQATTANTVFGQVATFNTIVQPSGGTVTNGIYQNVALTGGAGTGVQATITVSGGQVTSIVVQQTYGDSPGKSVLVSGSSYATGNTLGYTGTGLGTGGTVNVATLAPAWVLTRAADSNTSAQLIGQTVFVSGGTTYVGYAYVQTNAALTLDVTSAISGTSTIVQPTGTSVFPVVAGTYTNVPLTGGHGTGAGATIVVAGTGLGTVTIYSGGTGYTAGTYTGIALTGGSGSGAQATIVVNGSGVVTGVTITAAGSGYALTDQNISASNATIGGGSGSGLVLYAATLQGDVTSVTITSVGSGYQNDDVLSFSGYGGSEYTGAGPGYYGLGTGGTVEVTTSTPSSSAVTFVQLLPT